MRLDRTPARANYGFPFPSVTSGTRYDKTRRNFLAAIQLAPPSFGSIEETP
jgi:hypothetical protein